MLLDDIQSWSEKAETRVAAPLDWSTTQLKYCAVYLFVDKHI